MQAWFIRAYGDNDVVELGDVAKPDPGPRDVLIEMRAASVNPIDWKIRNGMLKRLIPYQFPLILGNDLAGVVAGKGDEVSEFEVGDEVYARPDKLRIGTFAEFIAVRADEVAKKPRNLSLVEASSLPLVGLTAWQAMIDIAGVEPGHKVLIQAGAGGVGTFAIQLARHLGAHVATTASEPKHALLRELGADQVIDYRSRDFAEVLSDYHMVFDMLGGEALKKAFAVIRPGGTVVSITGVPDPQFAREWNLPAMARLGLRLVSWPTRRRAAKRGATYRFLLMRSSGEQLTKIAQLVEQGVIKPVIDTVFDFDQAKQAIAHAEKGHATGKVVISRDKSAD
ncbi:MAG: NADP-dependent oxidoreductase [Proteobacteria bacterium]|nr:NADP-dependent oxidoreductase [Pseudomonadota bacterium]